MSKQYQKQKEKWKEQGKKELRAEIEKEIDLAIKGVPKESQAGAVLDILKQKLIGIKNKKNEK